MGEIADAMIEGVLCQVCGEYLGEGDGFPVTCPGCEDAAGGSGGEYHAVDDRVPCPICGKKVKPQGVNDHVRMKHNDA